MLSSKVILVQFVVVACLAGLVASAGLDTQVETIAKTVTGFVCEGCMFVMTGVKSNAPLIENGLQKLCDHQSCPDNKAKCQKAVGDLEDALRTKTPFELCKGLGICRV